MPQFDVSTYPSQIFWLAICFVFLCMMMAFYLVPRLASTLQAREQRQQEDWEDSKAFHATSESLRQENLKQLADAREKAHSLIHQTTREIHHRKANRIAILDEELAIKVKNIRQDLERQTEDILKNMEPIVSQVVKATSLRLLGNNLPQPEIKEVVRNVLKKRKQI
jgi:F-type H+-transporting ATPase subunit b